MPSPPYKLTASAPNLQITVPFTSAWVFVDNPTASPVLVRLAGTDYPTLSSADLIIPPAATELIPTIGRDFAFSFQSPSSVGFQSIYPAATILIGMTGELAPSFGTIQQFQGLLLPINGANYNFPALGSQAIVTIPAQAGTTHVLNTAICRMVGMTNTAAQVGTILVQYGANPIIWQSIVVVGVPAAGAPTMDTVTIPAGSNIGVDGSGVLGRGEQLVVAFNTGFTGVYESVALSYYDVRL